MRIQNTFQAITFLYHDVVENPSDSGFQRKSALPYKHKIKEFSDNLDIIFNNSDLIITINELKYHKNIKVTLLTFDDGGKSAMLIADYLEKYDLQGHFFITTSLIGDIYFLKEREIIELHARGHIIGSHSHSHPNVFNSLSFQDMVKEWSHSKSILENILKSNINACSIPGGDANKDSYYSAIDCGYKYIFNSEPTVKPRKIKDAIILGRVCPKKGTNYKTVENLSNFRGVRKQYAIRQLKNTARYILYPFYTKIVNSRKHGEQ